MPKIKVCYFSPTGGTLQVAKHLAESMSKKLCAEVEYHSYTLPKEREVIPVFDAGDVVVWATPVYAGRIPNKTLDYVRNALHGNGNLSVALVTFGNRAYDNALAELVGLMEDGGMRAVGAAAMVTRHVFSDTLGALRPNKDDISDLEDFATNVSEKILSSSNNIIPVLKVPGEKHYDKYYTPLKSTNAPANFLKAKPSCDAECCTRCGKCMTVCPMGSIEIDGDIPMFKGICIKCQACRLSCPSGAIAFTDPDYHSHIAMIEHNFSSPKQPEFFVVEE
ncbi:MAG: ferredoxin [Lentimicrobiaceae bacterium]|nr:ferredoxin [Lentimicrobiaceae bacterium]